MLRKLTLVSCLLLAGEMTHAGARSATEMPGATARDCAPPDNFSKRFPKLSENKALGKVTRLILRESYGLLRPDNPVTGAEVNSNNLYAKTMLGVAGYGRDHTFAAIVQPLGGERVYEIRISDTEYTQGSQAVFFNEVAELHVPYKGGTVVVPRKASWTEGFCGAVNVNGPPPSCFNTAIGSFTIERDLFEALAASDPAKPIAMAARKTDGAMGACPYYFSPLSFKATLLRIDDAYAKAAEREAGRRARHKAP
jgi:hypothetical protein